MHFHATAAAVSVRSKRISTLRNRLLCSVCTAMLLTGSGGMALTHPSAEPSAIAEPAPAGVAPAASPQTGPVVPTGTASGPKTVGNGETLPVKAGEKVDDLTVNGGGYAWTSGDGHIGKGAVNTGGQLGVFAEGTADTVSISESGFAWTYGKIGMATITGKDSRLYVESGGTAGTVTVNNGGKLAVVEKGTADTVNVNSGGFAWSRQDRHCDRCRQG